MGLLCFKRFGYASLTFGYCLFNLVLIVVDYEFALLFCFACGLRYWCYFVCYLMFVFNYDLLFVCLPTLDALLATICFC